MDPPFDHHRFVLPPPPSYPDSNPNMFSHHRFPPAPTLPPPPPYHNYPHHHSLPPPPAHPPPHQQFAFQHHQRRPPPPIEDHQSQFPNFIPRHLLSSPPPPPPGHPPPPPRVSSSHSDSFSEETYTNRNNDYINYHPHHRVEMQPRVRVSPEQSLPPHQQPPPLPRHEDYNPGLNFQSRFEDFERNERFRDERYGDNSLMYTTNNNNSNAGMSVPDSNEERRWDRKDMNFDIIDNYDSKCRDYIPNGRKYEAYDERKEDPMWDRVEYSPQRRNEYKSTRREPSLSSYDSDRFRDCKNRVKERSPKKKQTPKKSALLRIQLGKGGNSNSNNNNNSNRNRNRSHEYSEYSKHYLDENLNPSANFRGKEKREKTPVQLDVSFKSNSLVAKAIVSSPSQTVDSDKNTTHRNRKSRSNLSSSPLTKPQNNTMNVSEKSLKRSLLNNGTAMVSPKVKALEGGVNGSPCRRVRKRMKFTEQPRKEDTIQDNLATISQLGALPTFSSDKVDKSSKNDADLDLLRDSYASQSEVKKVSNDLESSIDTNLKQSTLSDSMGLLEFGNGSCEDAVKGVSLEVDVSVEGYLKSNFTSDTNIDDQISVERVKNNPECIANDDIGCKEFLVNQTIESLENYSIEIAKNSSCSNHLLDTSRLTISSPTGCSEKEVPPKDDLIRESLEGTNKEYSHILERKRKAVDSHLSSSYVNGEDTGIISVMGEKEEVTTVNEKEADHDVDTLVGPTVEEANEDSSMHVKKRKHNEEPDSLSMNVSSQSLLLPVIASFEVESISKMSRNSEDEAASVKDIITQGKAEPVINLNDPSKEVIDSVPNGLSHINSPENLSIKSLSEIEKDKESHKKPVSASDPELDKKVAIQEITKKPPTSIKTASSSLSNGTDKVKLNFNAVSAKSNLIKKNHLGSVFPVHPSQKFSAANAKTRTWHRSENPPGLVKGPGPGTGPVPVPQPSSYTRKGNKLVRNPSASSSSTVSRSNTSSVSNSQNKDKGKGKDTTNLQVSAISGGPNANIEKPKTPPLSSTLKLLNDSTSVPIKSTINMDLPKSCEDITKISGTDPIKKIEKQSVIDEKLLKNKVTYVKSWSNQLVAALGANVDKKQASSSSSSSGYYKSKNHQFVRTSLNNHVQESKMTKVSAKGTTKKNYKQPSKFSMVWTLESSKEGGNSDKCRKTWGHHLFPWKRATYRRNSLPIPKEASPSTISRKILLARKRKTLYKRSTSGFTIMRSKVVSVGGSNLKWSKSIERKSKKAHEEATLAVAAAEKNKKEKADLSRRNHVSRKLVRCIKLQPGERIFRVGSERYKMEPTRKTLDKITNDEDQVQQTPQSKENTKKGYIPKRLLIDNDEYVRIGNGNQLVMNPKRRSRTLASEKVRWSLHTVRMRLTKKKKYCQFFTRFGKCNKEDGKCSYIHDSSKIVVCTKFLKGACSNPSCKLTHEVIPERMSDCSYFLQGLCSNGKCPYRHVHVNPNACVCEGFLKGYCVDGNECRKKHTYVCPVFEASGECAQGSKCKLHHPRKRKANNTRKLKKSNGQGRYFGGSSRINRIGSGSGSNKHQVSESNKGKDDIFCQDGEFVGYISLGTISDDDDDEEEVEEEASVDSIKEVTCQPGSLGLDGSYPDELIKPLRVMKRFDSNTSHL